MSQPAESKKIIYLVRHGQSVDNTAPVFQSVQAPLSEKGRAQAQQIADRLRHISFETLISSPLPRTKDTAAAISQTTGKAAEFSDLFIERVKPQSIDGKPYDDPAAQAIYDKWEKSLYTPGLRVQDGENFDDLVARADKALEFLHNRPEQTLVVVTHGSFLRTIVARVVLGSDLTGPIHQKFQTRTSVENTAITALCYEDAYADEPRWRLWTLNDHAHFAE